MELPVMPEDERWKSLVVPVVIGGDNLPSAVGIGLTDLPNISGTPGNPNSGITDFDCRDVKSLLPTCRQTSSD